MARTDHDGISEQQKAGRHRFDDALTLFEEERWRGSMYIAGYAIECRLKAKLMRMFGCKTLAELEKELDRRGRLPADTTVYTHQLSVLVKLAGAFERIRSNDSIRRSFLLANTWLPAWRYDPDPSNREDAADFIEAVGKCVEWIENNL